MPRKGSTEACSVNLALMSYANTYIPRERNDGKHSWKFVMKGKGFMVSTCKHPIHWKGFSCGLTCWSVPSHWWHTADTCDRSVAMSSCCCLSIHNFSRMWASTVVKAITSCRFSVVRSSSKWALIFPRASSAVPWT